jgi:hypothetical protein
LEASVNGVDRELVLLDDEILLFLLSCKCFIAVVELAFVAFLEAPSTPATTNNNSLSSSSARSKLVRNALGSIAAGLVAGYLSHVPHNLSTMKLLNPAVSYGQHFGALVEKAERALPRGLPPHGRSQW